MRPRVTTAVGFALTLALLCAAVTRLWFVLSADFRTLQEVRERAVRSPRLGSLSGVAVDGAQVQWVRGEYLVMFGVRAANVQAEEQFWSDVARLASAGTRRVKYWGVCDSPPAHFRSSLEAFRLIAYLDPYQARVAALAVTDHVALVYDDGGWLKSRLPIADAPVVMAQNLARALEAQ